MKQKHIDYYMDIAHRTAELSTAKRLKVGAVYVSEDGIISIGYNGTPSGWDNTCEFVNENGLLETYNYVSHAEENLFAKLMKQGVSTKNGIIFLTDSPCINCAKIILNADITTVYYQNEYRITDGIDHLIKGGVEVVKYNQILK